MQHKYAVKALSVIFVIMSILIIFPNILTLFDAGFRESFIRDGYDRDFPFKPLAFGKLIVSGMLLAGSAGLLKLKEWGRQAATVALILLFVLYVIDSWYSAKSHVDVIPLPSLIFIFGLPIYYLSRKNVRALLSDHKGRPMRS